MFQCSDPKKSVILVELKGAFHLVAAIIISTRGSESEEEVCKVDMIILHIRF